MTITDRVASSLQVEGRGSSPPSSTWENDRPDHAVRYEATAHIAAVNEWLRPQLLKPAPARPLPPVRG